MWTNREPGDELGVSEAEVADVVRVREVRDSDLFVSVAGDDVLAARAQSQVEQHGQVAEQADTVVGLRRQVELEDVASLV